MRVAAILLSLATVIWSAQASAFRPFDGADAAVTDVGQVTAEIAPAGYVREGSERVLVAPAASFAYGVAPRWEAALKGRTEHGLSTAASRFSLVGNVASLKHVLLEGSLQKRTGPSVAAEVDLLLPGINDESGVGGSLIGFVSQRWDWGTLHVNLAGTVTRQQHGDVFIRTIIEGPDAWTVRPVAEFFHEREFGGQRTSSALVGAIWQIRDTLAIDAALRGARVNTHTLGEIRLGLTFGFGL